MTAARSDPAGTPADAAAIAALHAEAISIGFLVVLGEPFLEQLYRRVAGHDRSFVFVHADPSKGIDGFVAVAEDTGRLYREFMVHDGLRAGWRAAPAVLRHPWKVLETLRYGAVGRTTDAGRRDPRDRGRGGARGATASAKPSSRRRPMSSDGAVSSTHTW